MNDQLDEILLSFYNGVEGNLDIRHGYPPIHMDEAKAKLQALLLRERIDELKKMMIRAKDTICIRDDFRKATVTKDIGLKYAHKLLQDRIKELEAQLKEQLKRSR